MKEGKQICETLKAIRSKIASANEIDYTPNECHHEGDCAGTCPACESEMRWLERQLRNRQALGKAVTIAGLSVALGAMSTSCHKIFQQDGFISPTYPPGTEQTNLVNGGNTTQPVTVINNDGDENPNDSIEKYRLMGDVVAMPAPSTQNPDNKTSTQTKKTSKKKNTKKKTTKK